MNKKSINRRSANSKVKIPNFKSIYGKLLFFHLKSHIGEDYYSISLESLKSILLAPSLSYTYSNLRIKVLDIINDEFISINSPILFSYTVINENNTCLIKFIIFYKN